MDSCLTLGNELSQETHVLKKQKTLLKRGAGVDSGRVTEPRRTALPCGSPSQVLRRWGWFPGCLWPVILLMPIFGPTQGPSGWRTHAPVKMDSSVRVPGRLGGTYGLASPPSFWPLPNSSRWFSRQLVSSVFLIGTSCCETVYARDYFHAWPERAVSVDSSLTFTWRSGWAGGVMREEERGGG